MEKEDKERFVTEAKFINDETKREVPVILKQISDEDHGYACLVTRVLQHTVKITKGGGYVWTSSKRLWIHHSSKDIANMIPEVVEKEVGWVLKELKTEENKTSHDDMDAMERIAGKVNLCNKALKLSKKTNKIRDIWYQVESMLYKLDMEFELNVNTRKDCLPIKGCQMINLRTGKVRSRRRTDLWTFELSIEVSDNEDGIKLIDDFVLDLMNGNKRMKTYLQMYMGYCLTAETVDRSFCIMYGRAAAGKSTIGDMIETVLTDRLVARISRNMLMLNSKSSGRGDATPGETSMIDKRVAIGTESNKKDTFDSAHIKQMTGERRMAVRELYKEQKTVNITAKIILETNYMPNFDPDDVSMIDRCKIVPFTSRYVDHPNPELGEKKRDTKLVNSLLTTYKNELFTWILQGSMMFYETMYIKIPRCVQRNIDDLMIELDDVKKFIHECCVRDTKGKEKTAALYSRYEQWCEGYGKEVIPPRIFVPRLEKEGFPVRKVSVNHAYGLYLKPDDE